LQFFVFLALPAVNYWWQ